MEQGGKVKAYRWLSHRLSIVIPHANLDFEQSWKTSSRMYYIFDEADPRQIEPLILASENNATAEDEQDKSTITQQIFPNEVLKIIVDFL